MPTYDYKCAQCGYFEVEQRITDQALSACPTCGEPVKRLIPRKLYIQFKGPGFHVNDYPSGHRPTADAGADSQAGTPKAAAETATSAATPAAEAKKAAGE